MCSVIYPLHRCVTEYDDNRTMLKYADGIVLVSQLQDNETSVGLLLYFTVLTNIQFESGRRCIDSKLKPLRMPLPNCFRLAIY